MEPHLRIPPPTEPVADLVHALLAAHAGDGGALADALGGPDRLERGGLAATTGADRLRGDAVARLAVRAANLPDLEGYESAAPRGEHSALQSAARVRVELRASAPDAPGAKGRIELALRTALGLVTRLTSAEVQAAAAALWPAGSAGVAPVRVAGRVSRFGGLPVPALDGASEDWTAALFVEIQAFSTAETLSAAEGDSAAESPPPLP